MHFIAVYGSLKKGFYNWGSFELGEPITTAGIRGSMYLCGSYPRLYKESDSDAEKVLEHGVEIYEVDDAKFHAIEGMELGAGYSSEIVKLVGDDDKEYDCTVYFSLPNRSKEVYIDEYTKQTVPHAWVG